MKIKSLSLLLFAFLFLPTNSEAKARIKSARILIDTIYSADDVDKKPEPIKGIEYFYTKVAKKYRYTPEALEHGVSGKMLLHVTIDTKGHLVEASIKEGLGMGLDEEAIRVFKKINVKWHPGIKNNEDVKTRMIIPLVLKIDN